MEPSDETTVDLLGRAAKALKSAHEYRVTPEHVPVADALLSRAERLREGMRVAKIRAEACGPLHASSGPATFADYAVLGTYGAINAPSRPQGGGKP